MKYIRLRINDLIDQHGDSFDKCQGCAKCTEIKQLRKSLEREPAIKYKHILDKGQDMTKSDIAFLLENEVDKKMIRKALKMQSEDFLNMMVNFGFSKRRKPKEEKEMAKITLEEYQDYKAQGLTDSAIAVKQGTTPNYLSQLKRKWFKKDAKPAVKSKKSNEANPSQTPKQPAPAVIKAPETKPIGTAFNEALNEAFAEKSAEYERLIAALRNDLNTAHQQLDEKDEKIRNLEHLHAACEDCENEISSLQQEKAELEKKLHLIQEATKQTNANYLENAKKLKPLEEENQAMRLLIKKWA